ncbi:Eco57I restriction-modification methylase domain-containing protein, partial [Prevotella amnii]
MAYTAEQLSTIFQSKFNLKEWTQFLTNFIGAKIIRQVPEQLELDPSEGKGYYLGQKATTDNYEIGLFYIKTNTSVKNRRVGLRQIVKPYLRYLVDAALVVFDDGNNWRLSFVCDIKGESTSPKRYTFVFGDSGSYYNTAVSRFSNLQNKGVNFANLKEAFSVEALSKDFYTKLYSWYQWALSDEVNVTFPNNPDTEKDDRENMNVKLIRLITRLLFVWFVKQKNLVPNNIFDIAQLKKILVDFNPYATDNGNYYNAILQNLFFATLNCAIIDEEGSSRQFAIAKSARDTRNLYRYAEMFSISEDEVVKLFAKVPFLNGGLFECLDKPKGLYLKQEYDVLYDGFSRNGTRSSNGNFKYRAFIPNILFFNDDELHPGLINLLSQYNFTIEENSPTDAVVSLDPELLGRVFENLLADFNEETHVSARKATGSFYTPREIVDYMVDESIKSYLLGKDSLGIDANSLNELFVKKNIPANWNVSTCHDVAEALKNIKILDPACGSGAFPMGCLHRIVELEEILSKDNIDRYNLKLSIIENCVYGVDIQPIAMLICKLRFFISLICEQTNVDFNSPETNFGINTLPNLETKFVAANSLISADIRSYENDWTADEKLSQLKEQLLNIRNEHFLAKGRKAKRQSQRMDEAKREEIMNYIVKHSTEPDASVISVLEKEVERLQVNLKEYEKEVWVNKTRPAEVNLFGVVESPDAIFREDINKKKRDELNAQIRTLENNIRKEKSKGEIVGFEAAVKQITEWNPYDQNSVSTFFDPEWMFCLKEKFDIVIGNPPYIQLQNNGGELAKLYDNCNYSTFARTGDIYCLFYERGWQLLKKNGHLCYITSNKWMRAGYGEKTREFFANNTNPMLLIDFAGVQVFESATVDTDILLFAKSSNKHKTLCAVTNKQNKDSVKNLSHFVQQQNTICSFSSSDSWVILSPIEQSIKCKIEAVGTPLKDWDINIYRGVLTGCNEAFIISTEKRDEILANCQTEDERTRTAELIRPILRGRDIKRYGYEWAELWLIATFPSCHYNIDEYPAVKQYLLSFGIERLEQTGKTHIVNGKKVKARKKTNNKWSETQDSI